MINTSMVASLVWVKCIKSKAKNTVAKSADSVCRVILRAKSQARGTMAIPHRAPAMRQPKGFMPKTAIPAAMRIFPRGGCVVS